MEIFINFYNILRLVILYNCVIIICTNQNNYGIINNFTNTFIQIDMSVYNWLIKIIKIKIKINYVNPNIQPMIICHVCL